MNIEIKGVQFINKGAELMLHAILQQLSELAPNANIVLRPKKGAPYHKRIGVGAFQKLTLTKSIFDLNIISYWLPKRFRTWLMNQWGVITEADIDILLDASGFAYGDQWSSMALRQLAKEVNRFHDKGKVYIFMPQALGPFSRKEDQQRLSKSLPNASLILAREKSSFQNVSSLGVPEDLLMQYPDFTNLLKGQCPPYFDYDKPVFLVIPNSKMLSDKNDDSVWHNEYIPTLLNAISYATEQGLTPIVLNHEGPEDQRICDLLVGQFDKPIKLIQEDNPLYVKGIIGQSKLVLCSRFHGCVSALSQGVPCIATSWSYKYERLFEDYNRSELLIRSPIKQPTLEKMMSKALDDRLSENHKHVVDQKVLSAQMWQHIKMFIH